MGPRRLPLSLDGREPGATRRSFLKRGLLGAALLALGGTGFLATRRTRVPIRPGAALGVLTPEEAAVLLAIAERLVPQREGFPRPADIDLAARLDAAVALADPATRDELRQVVRLFESALAGFLLDGEARLFTSSSPEAQDRRLRAWARSRLALRRTGYRALKKLVYASYYAAPETWAAVGYGGPPLEVGEAGGRGAGAARR